MQKLKIHMKYSQSSNQFLWRVISTIPTRNLPLDHALFEEIGATLMTDIVVEPCNEEEIIFHAREVDVVVSQTAPFSQRVLKALEKCRFIMIARLGIENVDLDAATERGIFVSNLGPYCKDEVSDHAMALLLILARRICELREKVREGFWGAPFMHEGIKHVWEKIHRIRGKVLGLVGLGAIGRSVAEKAKVFGLRLIAYDPYVQQEVARQVGVDLVDFETLLKESDFISIHCPLTSETRNLFNLNAFRKMKPTACLVNVARGEIVDTEALYTALIEGMIAGAGLDVLGEEVKPTSADHPIYKLPNVIITGHSAFFSQEAVASVPVIVVEEVARVLRGECPRNLLNPAAKERWVERFGPLKESR